MLNLTATSLKRQWRIPALAALAAVLFGPGRACWRSASRVGYNSAAVFADGVPVFERIGLIRTRDLGDQVAASCPALKR